MDLSPTAYVILGMLRSSPKSGYEIKSVVDHSTRFFWAASYGQIYPELKRLAADGLVEGTEEPRGERKRTVYRLTKLGQNELKGWLRRPPATYELRDEGFLKLFFAGALPPAEAVEIVQSMRDHHLAVAEQLREIEPKAIAAGGYPLIVLRGGIEYHEHFADWCERVESQILAETRSKERSA